MNNPLDQVGVPVTVGLAKPIVKAGTNNSGPVHRVSFEVSKETFEMIQMAKKSRSLLLEATLVLVNYDDNLVGGYLSNIAGMMCKDPYFHSFLREKALLASTQVEETSAFKSFAGKSKLSQWELFSRHWILKRCHVESRRQLDHSTEAQGLFAEIQRDFVSYCQRIGINATYIGVGN